MIKYRSIFFYTPYNAFNFIHRKKEMSTILLFTSNDWMKNEKYMVQVQLVQMTVDFGKRVRRNEVVVYVQLSSLVV